MYKRWHLFFIIIIVFRVLVVTQTSKLFAWFVIVVVVVRWLCVPSSEVVGYGLGSFCTHTCVFIIILLRGRCSQKSVVER